MRNHSGRVSRVLHLVVLSSKSETSIEIIEMKSIFILSLVTLAAAVDTEAPFRNMNIPENSLIQQITSEESEMSARGSYSYTSPEGEVIKVDWVADENGFQPSGTHLPVAPPMPDHVVKLLADLRAVGVK